MGEYIASGPDFLIICLSPVDGIQTAITSEIMILQKGVQMYVLSRKKIAPGWA